MITATIVRDEILAQLGRQACHRPADWPHVLGSLLKLEALPATAADDALDPTDRQLARIRRALDREDPPFGSLLPRLNQAAASLAEVLAAGAPLGVVEVWRVFPRFTRESCRALAVRLAELARETGTLAMPRPPGGPRTAPGASLVDEPTSRPTPCSGLPGPPAGRAVTGNQEHAKVARPAQVGSPPLLVSSLSRLSSGTWAGGQSGHQKPEPRSWMRSR
jgi:hypothetical protein